MSVKNAFSSSVYQWFCHLIILFRSSESLDIRTNQNQKLGLIESTPVD